MELLNTAFLITSFVTLFITVDPVGLTPAFVSLTLGASNYERKKIAFRATMVAAVILIIFCLFGESVLEFVGISMPAFQIAGGILLFITALDMLFDKRSKRRKNQSGEGEKKMMFQSFHLPPPSWQGQEQSPQ